MDNGNQALTNKEMAIQQAEAETGNVIMSRTNAMTDPDPTQLDPRFDRDDLRQGKPPPAVRKHHLRRKIKIRRPRAKKGLPFKRSGEDGAEGALTDIEGEEADMTDDEVEIPVEEADEDAQEGDVEEEGDKKKEGVFSHLFHKNSTS